MNAKVVIIPLVIVFLVVAAAIGYKLFVMDATQDVSVPVSAASVPYDPYSEEVTNAGAGFPQNEEQEQQVTTQVSSDPVDLEAELDALQDDGTEDLEALEDEADTL